MKRWWVLLCGLCIGFAGFGMSFWGKWDITVELAPNLRVYESNLILDYGFLPGWRIESESKIYSDGLLRYQNFYISGSFGDFSVWGKMYFHAQEVRYQKMWLNAEAPIGGGTLRFSFNHWASSADYTSSDRDMFGPWPCTEVISWEDAWKHMTRSVSVVGPVASASYSGGNVYINVGYAYPDPYRFQVFISSAYVDDFEAKFGPNFWVDWVRKTICVRGTIKGYRYTSGGPGNEGYSVAEIAPTSPDDVVVDPCFGVSAPLTCPAYPVIRWFEARHFYVGQTVCVQGPVASVTGPGTYHGVPNSYRIRIGGGDGVDNRVELILPYHPGWPTVGSSYTTEVCACGTIELIGGLAVIRPPNVISAQGSPCCTSTGLSGTLVNWQLRYTLSPFTITADFVDCSLGTWFRQVKVDMTNIGLCCGLSFDASLTFTKAKGLESVAFTLKEFPFLCCGLVATLETVFTPTSKTVSFKPTWPGLLGCLTVYGDINWSNNTWLGLVVYGWDVGCMFGPWYVRTVTALDPDKVEDLTDITFYTGEFEYLDLEYATPGCCGGDLTFQAQFWFGNQGKLFGLQRFRYDVSVPLAANIEFFSKAQWNLAQASPLQWFDIGWEVSF